MSSEVQSVDVVLARDIPWETYMTARLITDRELQLIRRYDKRTLEAKAALLSEDGLNYVEAFIAVLRNVNKDETVEYALATLEEMVDQNEGAIAPSLLKSSGGDPFTVFLRLLQRPDLFTQNRAAKLLAIVLDTRPNKNAPLGAGPSEPDAPGEEEDYGAREPILSGFVEYLCGQLRRPLDATCTATATAALSRLLKERKVRSMFVRGGGVGLLAPLLRAPPAATSSKAANQQLYEAVLCVWQLSYMKQAVTLMAQSGVAAGLVDVVKAAQKEKVLRVASLALKNLLQTDPQAFAADMVDAGLVKAVQQRKLQSWGDEDLIQALEWLSDSLKDSIVELSSFDKYKKEVLSGSMDWSPMHTDEPFWRQNADRFEERDCQVIKALLRLVEQSRDSRTLAVSCNDVGQFITYHPRGRYIVNELKGKELVMRLMTHPDIEVKKQALLACQKLMLTKDKLELVLGRPA